MAGSENHDTPEIPKFDNGPRLLIVAAAFYRDIADSLCAGAQAVIESAGGTFEIAEVPGALEIPAAIRLGHGSGKFDGFVALGCVIRGETTHYETVCTNSSRAISLMGLDAVCIGNGILTVETRRQAELRADPAGQNRGGGAALAALHLIALSERFAPGPKGIGFKPASEHIMVADSGIRQA
ncbi:MAG: 6,7-dimethyl-8-ribityllumazine synthase [Rhodobacteraceae bacterium]|nr:6,7-dimethyl-8-ribityllumazine synthase [Paracoccaceae bacterium]